MTTPLAPPAQSPILNAQVGIGHRVLVVDNDDSFTGSLVQQIYQLGGAVDWIRGAELTDRVLAEAEAVLLSPGPGRPAEHPAMLRVWSATARPVFGVCLGMQSLAEFCGGVIRPARHIVHGRTSLIHHRGTGVFAGTPSPMRATRYHSLAVDREALPGELEVTAWTADGEIMGLRHRTQPWEGVQFHPESVRTSLGLQLIAAWLASLPSPNGR